MSAGLCWIQEPVRPGEDGHRNGHCWKCHRDRKCRTAVITEGKRRLIELVWRSGRVVVVVVVVGGMWEGRILCREEETGEEAEKMILLPGPWTLILLEVSTQVTTAGLEVENTQMVYTWCKLEVKVEHLAYYNKNTTANTGYNILYIKWTYVGFHGQNLENILIIPVAILRMEKTMDAKVISRSTLVPRLNSFQKLASVQKYCYMCIIGLPYSLREASRFIDDFKQIKCIT